MSWQIERKLAERLADETGYYKYPFGTRRAMGPFATPTRMKSP